MPNSDRWLALARPTANAAVRLFCLPHAGVGASLYARWVGAAPPGVDLLPIQLPGRETRFCEPALESQEALVGQLAEALPPLLDRPFGFFGYSMGALIAHRLALVLAERGLPLPSHLFAAAHRAPHLTRPGPNLHDLPSERFWNRLRDYNGVPHSVLENRELRELLEPSLRADFMLVETASLVSDQRLSCTLVAIGGSADPTVNLHEIAAWRESTTGSCEIVTLPGDHFFIASHPELLMHSVFSRLSLPSKEPVQSGNEPVIHKL